MTSTTVEHPAHPCQVCRYCTRCGCDRGGVCQDHQSTDGILAGLLTERARYEQEVTDPALTVVIVARGHGDRGGRMHARHCREVTGAVARLNHLISNPVEIHYNVWSTWPGLYRPTDPELDARKRCTLCAPDVLERKRPPRQRRSKLGWPGADGKIV